MNYTFKEINSNDLNNLTFDKAKSHIFQTSYWAEFKSEWDHKFFMGCDEKEKIVLTCVLLIRKLPLLNHSLAYIPRGFVCDYTNKELLSSFTTFLKEFSKKNKIAFLTIDPDIHLKENECEIEFGAKVCETLKEIGYIKNSSSNFENIQPNFVFRLNLPQESVDLSKEDIKKNMLKHFSSKARYNIKLGIERGLSVQSYSYDELKDGCIEVFQNLMDITGKRDNFIVRKKDYFLSMMKFLNPYCRLFLVKYSYEDDKNNIYKKINKCKSNIDNSKIHIIKLEESLKDITDEAKIQKITTKINTRNKEISINESQIDVLEKKLQIIAEYKGKDIYLSGAIYLYLNDKAWYLYGASHNILRDTMPNFLMQYEMIKYSIDKGCSIYDFRGVSGDLSEDNPLYGLYKFKKMFNGDFTEFIGEHSLVINKSIYSLFKNIFPKFKDIRNLLQKTKR